MIARVKIAPVERWCQFYRDKWNADPFLVGRMVEIVTETCRTDCWEVGHQVGCRWWNISERQAKATFAFHGVPDDGSRALCEHVLEMD